MNAANALGFAVPEPVRRLTRTLSWHRRLFSAALVAIAVAAGLSALAPAGPRLVQVLVAARDLPAGLTLQAGDLTTLGLPATSVPTGALSPSEQVDGRVLAAAVRRHEPVTDVRLVGAALVGSLADTGLVATPVRIADPGAARLLQPGDLVDVLAAAARDVGPATVNVVAAGARVLAVPDPSSAPSGIDDGALVLLATTPQTAALLARSSVTSRLSVTIRG